MNKTILVDTNYLLDLALPERNQRTAALAVFDAIEEGEVDAIVAATSLKDVYYVLSRAFGEPESRRFVKAAMAFIEPAAVDAAICTEAIDSNEPDFEDGIIRACAERANAAYIISRDGKAFDNSSIKRLSSADFAKRLGRWEQVELP